MRHITTALTIALVSGVGFAEQRNAGSHVHGLNHATIILEGSRLQIAYEFPAEQLAEQGHDEHKHDDHDEKEHELSEQLQTIESIFSMVRLHENAQCKEIKVTHSVTQVGGNDKEHTGHYDALIQATLECGAPENLANLSFEPAFEQFDDIEKIEVEGVIGNKALSETLTATSPSLAL